MNLFQHYERVPPKFSTNFAKLSQENTRTLVDVRAVSLFTRLLALLLLAISRCLALPCCLLGSFGGFGCLRLGRCLGGGRGGCFAGGGSRLKIIVVKTYPSGSDKR